MEEKNARKLLISHLFGAVRYIIISEYILLWHFFIFSFTEVVLRGLRSESERENLI